MLRMRIKFGVYYRILSRGTLVWTFQKWSQKTEKNYPMWYQLFHSQRHWSNRCWTCRWFSLRESLISEALSNSKKLGSSLLSSNLLQKNHWLPKRKIYGFSEMPRIILQHKNYLFTNDNKNDIGWVRVFNTPASLNSSFSYIFQVSLVLSEMWAL
jgi:hypothetical protein